MVYIHVLYLPNCASMRSKGSMTLLVNLSLVFLKLLLFFDDSQELISLSLGLLGQHDFFLEELLLTGHVQVFGHLLLLLNSFTLLTSGLTLTLFEGSLGAKSINLTLAVSSSLLKFSQTLDLLLLLVSCTTLVSESGFFLGISFLVVLEDLQVLFFLLFNFLLLLL